MRLWIPAILTLALGTTARAVTNYDPTNISNLTNAAVEAMIKTVAIGGSHKSYLPAKPLGHVPGLDLGLTVDIITVPQEFKDALAVTSGTSASSIPSLVPLPKLALYKGLPGGFDIGTSYISYQSVFKSFGGAVRWGSQLPGGQIAVGLQVAGNYTKVFFLSTHTYSLDCVVSKGFALIEPYLGAGVQMWAGDLAYTVGSGAFQTGVSGHQSGTTPHFYFGFPLKMAVLRLTGQVDYSTAGVVTYGTKLALSF